MLSLKSQEKLANILSTVSEGECKLEQFKTELCKFKNFEPFTIFTRLDRQQNGYLTINDFNNFFLSHRTSQNNTELSLLFAKFKPSQPRQILEEEMAATILPRSNPQLAYEVQQRKKSTVEPKQFLELKLEQALLVIFQQLIRNARSYELYRDTLLSAYDFSQAGCFYSITDEPYITRNSLYAFLQQHFRFQSPNELNALADFLDYDCDGQISFEDFVNSIVKSGLQLGNVGECQYRREEEIGGFSPSKVIASLSPTKSQLISPRKRAGANAAGKQLIVLKNIEDQNQIVQNNLKYSNYIKSVKGQENVICWDQVQTEIQSPTKIIDLLKKMIIMDRELTQLKQKLTNQEDFNLLDAFSFFDIEKKQKISYSDFIKGLNKLGINPEQEQMFGDFCKIFSTKNEEQMTLLKSRNPKYIEATDPSQIFTPNTLSLITQLFYQIFQSESSLDELRAQLQLQPLFNLSHAFSSLDQDKDGRISYEELKQILVCYGFDTSENDMLCLFERFDKDKDGKIKFQEFVSEIEPKSPMKKRGKF